MSAPIGQSRVETYVVEVSPKTTWIFVRLTGPDGIDGVGEATLNAKTAEVVAAIPEAAGLVPQGTRNPEAGFAIIRQTLGGAIGRVVASGLEQAWLDREGKRNGRSVVDLLGGACRSTIVCYANINRGTLSRAPEEFAERSVTAVREGYGAVKLAPFDDLVPDDPDANRRTQLLQAGFRRVAAVRAAVPTGTRIMVDCHSRLRLAEAESVMHQLASNGVSWFEEPVAETAANLPFIAALRKSANAIGVTLAGAEKSADASAFRPFLSAACYDVVMPDIILTGGPAEVMKIGKLAEQTGTSVSLHNPCGPVMDVHSANVAAALPSLLLLERQYRETSLYDDLVQRAHPLHKGAYEITSIPGAGIEIDWAHPRLQLHNAVSVAL